MNPVFLKILKGAFSSLHGNLNFLFKKHNHVGLHARRAHQRLLRCWASLSQLCWAPLRPPRAVPLLHRLNVTVLATLPVAATTSQGPFCSPLRFPLACAPGHISPLDPCGFLLQPSPGNPRLLHSGQRTDCLQGPDVLLGLCLILALCSIAQSICLHGWLQRCFLSFLLSWGSGLFHMATLLEERLP